MNIQKLKQITLKLIIDHCLGHRPTLILGLSGGPDSVFLFFLLKELHEQKRIKLVVAHLDHGWRDESAQDAQFCQNLCEKHSIPLNNHHADNLSITIKFNGSREEVGRTLRRHFLEQVKNEHNADFIVLAHHQQDQQETFLIRLLRGSSLSGLRCMDTVRGNYLRPLLHISKEEILKHLKTNNIAFRDDATNHSDEFLRNRIRKHLIPAFRQCDERFDQKFATTLKHLKAEDDFIQNHTLTQFNQVFTNKESIFFGELKQFKTLSATEQKRLVLHWLVAEKAGFNVSDGFINEILMFLTSDRGGTHQLSLKWNIQKRKNLFWITKHL